MVKELVVVLEPEESAQDIRSLPKIVSDEVC